MRCIGVLLKTVQPTSVHSYKHSHSNNSRITRSGRGVNVNNNHQLIKQEETDRAVNYISRPYQRNVHESAVISS